MSKLLLILLWGWSFMAQGCDNQKQVQEGKIAFREIEHGNYCGINKAQQIVLRDSNSYGELWKELTALRSNKEMKEVNFDKEMVVAVFMGQRNTGGYDLKITRIEEKDKVRVYYDEISPGPTSIVTMALTSPYHLVAVPKSTKPVEFIMNEKIRK